ncbi:MAG: alpha/beta fold hydrolase [Acidimicrobiales bacterium]|nr:alpha/beta fold hydrolase [Acidimicrobiales bacterium]
MDLHSERSGTGPRLVLAHGFTQNRRCWGALADELTTDHEVIRVDLPGHGRSGVTAADLPTTAALLGEAGGPATYLGYSLGGRVALHLALARPDLVRGLVLIGATAGIDDPAERAARRRADAALADELERTGLDAFLQRWLAGPLFETLPPDAAFVEARRESSAEGLASSLRLAGAGRQEPLWERLASLRMPVLVLAGALDDRFCALGRRLASAIGTNATFAAVPGAGHAAHLERPAEVLALVRPWLRMTERGPTG